MVFKKLSDRTSSGILISYLSASSAKLLSIILNYAFNGDTNGVFYYAGTNYGSELWSNPHSNGKIIVSSSSLALGNHALLVDRQSSEFFTNNEFNAYVSFDLQVNHSLTVNGYLLRTRNNSYSHYPRSWELRGSNNNSNWTVLDSQVNNTALVSNDQWLYIPINGIVQSYRYLRIVQTNANSEGNFYLVLGEVELYGTFY